MPVCVPVPVEESVCVGVGVCVRVIPVENVRVCDTELLASWDPVCVSEGVTEGVTVRLALPV